MDGLILLKIFSPYIFRKPVSFIIENRCVVMRKRNNCHWLFKGESPLSFQFQTLVVIGRGEGPMPWKSRTAWSHSSSVLERRYGWLTENCILSRRRKKLKDIVENQLRRKSLMWRERRELEA